MMKVCILGNQDRAVRSFWTVLMRHMRDAGCTVRVCIPEGDAQTEEAIADVSDGICHFSLNRKGLNPLQDLRTFRDLCAIFRRERPDYVFATTIKPVIYGCLAARLTGVPHIYATITGLGYTFETDSLFKRVIHAVSVGLHRMALSRIEGCFFQNPDDLAVFRSCHILRDDMKVCMARGTGVDTARFAHVPPPPVSDDTPLTFLLVGRLLEAKGIRDYVEAARIIHRTHPHVRFRLLGPEEPMRGGISLDNIRAWQKEGCIEYPGSTDDVRPYLQACHILVLPSWREGIPTAVMEAMSVGRGIIVSDAPGCREVIRPGENGWMVEVRNPASLADACMRIIQDPSSVERFGAESRRMAEQIFDADVVARGILTDMGIVR